MNNSNLRHIDLVVGLGHGDEGKGMTALSLAYLRTIGKSTIIACKGNGSGQASHKVMFDNNSGAGEDKQSLPLVMNLLPTTTLTLENSKHFIPT